MICIYYTIGMIIGLSDRPFPFQKKKNLWWVEVTLLWCWIYNPWFFLIDLNSFFLFTGINTFSETPSKEWFQVEAVLRVSLGNFLFFVIFAVTMIGVKDQNDRRDSWHHGGWTAKIVIWVLLIVLMFFLPNGIIDFYGKSNEIPDSLLHLAQICLIFSLHSFLQFSFSHMTSILTLSFHGEIIGVIEGTVLL